MASADAVCAGVTTTSPSTTTVTSEPDPITACANALAQVQVAQAAVSTAQNNLATASAALDALLADQSTTSTTTPATAGSGSGGSGAPATAGTGAAAQRHRRLHPTASPVRRRRRTSSPTRKAVDADQAAVTQAQQAVAQATIVSPISGKVIAVNMAVGDTVTSASTTSTIIVKGAGGYEVTTDVSVDKITDVAVGQSALVLPDGSNQKLAGKVVSISGQPDSSSSSTAYRVVVGLDNPAAKLNNGVSERTRTGARLS